MSNKIEFNEEWALEFYRKGWSDPHIERELGLPSRTIGNWRKRNGLPSNYPSGWAGLSKEERQEIIRRRQEEYRAERDEKLRLQKEMEERRRGECLRCKYQGTLDGYEMCCDYCYITTHARIAMEKRDDGLCPAFEEGEPVRREVLFYEQPIKIVRKKRMRYSHEKMLELYMAGKNDSEIAAETGCEKSSVYAWRHRNQLPANERGKESKYDGEEFRKLYDKKMSDGKIARACGCTESTVSRWRHSQGLPAWGHGEKMDPVKARELYDQGMNDIEIAKALGRSDKTVRIWRQENNLPTQREKKRGAKHDE